MNVDFNFEKPLDEIVAEVLRMETILEDDQAELMSEIGKEIKKQTRDLLPKSDEEHKHMRDDIKVTVNGKKKKIGVTGVTVHGGKETAYKWHLLDDGTRNPDGTIHTPAHHFTKKAMEAATPHIEALINNMERRIVQ